MVHLRKEDESEERNRASFPRWGKLRVVSHHFTKLVFKILEMRKRTQILLAFICLFFVLKFFHRYS